MNIKYTALLSLSSCLLFSCSQEEWPASHGDDEMVISFHTSMPGLGTRSETTTLSSLENGFHVTAFCPEDETRINGTNMSEYFAEELVTPTPGIGDVFRSEMCRWPENEGSKKGTLKFFAFYPSREALREHAGVDDNSGYFNLKNSSTTTSYSYVVEKFKINKDISRHVDFVTATAEGTKSDNLYSGVSLNFEHQLTRLELMAYGNSSSYDIEIAGVRLGNVFTESDFNIALKSTANTASADNTKNGRWLATNQKRGIVEYIYREGELVVPIGSGTPYTSSANATSIMGKAGHASIIPASYSKWNKTATNTGLYFSVLLRVKDKYGTQLYPYIEDANMSTSTTTAKMNVVYLSVNKTSGEVRKRLYKKGDNYFSDEAQTLPYSPGMDEEIREYGWAALPPTNSTTLLKAGYQYIVRLGYGTGVGVEDPADAFPGKAIIWQLTPSVKVTAFTIGNEEDITDKITIVP